MSQVKKRSRAPEYWRSFAEYEDRPEFRELLEREFPSPCEAPPETPSGRRRFMQLMGASMAMAGATSACRWQEDKILPHTQRPEGHIPGVPQYFATSMELGGVAIGLWAKSFDGRPIKIEGNPQDPFSVGATSPLHQASVLGLYDPDRSDAVVRRKGQVETSSWDDFDAFFKAKLEELGKDGGAGLALLCETTSSVTVASLKRKLLAKYPQAKWVSFDAGRFDFDHLGHRMVFGQSVRARLFPEKADVLVGLDADLMCAAVGDGLANARAVANRREPESGKLSRLYAFESTLTELGALADHRVALRVELFKALAAQLDAAISAKASPLPEHGPAQTAPDAAFLEDEQVAPVVAAAVQDLLANPGRSLVVAGSHLPPEVHALVQRINVLLGNAGKTVEYLALPEELAVDQYAAVKELIESMTAGAVNTLVILGGNPLYSLPPDLGFKPALAKVAETIRLGVYQDETSAVSSWHLPQAHYLESWGDARAFDGSIRTQQPLIAPMLEGRSIIEFLSSALGEAKVDARKLVQDALAASLPNDKAWQKAVHDGIVPNSAFETVTPTLKPLPAMELSERERGPYDPGAETEVVFALDARVHDGRFANLAWLQELPDPTTKLTWGNAALIHPATALKAGIKDGHSITLSVGDESIKLPAMWSPAQARGSVHVSLGYGRRAAGHVGGLAPAEVEPVGVDAYPLRKSTALVHAPARVQLAGDRQPLATVQDLHAIDDTGKDGVQKRLGQLIREGTLAEYQKKPDFARDRVHHPPLLNLWESPVSYTGRKWGMSIDLNKCSGCSSCIVACQAENNIPVVGKDSVLMGRELHWLRVDRYYRGDDEHADAKHQPVPCMHCENAPCEQVCPVGATMHSSEGLNDMVYNRCIGTRYCSNNCPYKVRRFNYLNYNLELYGTTPYTGTDDPKAKLKSMVLNPDVTVRGRGVMEKCTFCVQRIQDAKIRADNAARPLADGEVQTACAQACPTEAIVFGDLNDGKSRVAKLQARPRSYGLLEELNNRPRVRYLARVSNPHPDLSSEEQDHGNSERH